MDGRVWEEARKERLKLLREVEGLLSFIRDPVLVVDAQGYIAHTNSAAEQILERPQIVVIGKHITEFVQSTSLSQHIKQGRPVASLAVCMRNVKGDCVEFSCRLHPLLVDKNVEGAILFFTKPVLRNVYKRRVNLRHPLILFYKKKADESAFGVY
ncbi:PAS domain-containing protein [Caldibacillus thermoamylovorans]